MFRIDVAANTVQRVATEQQSNSMGNGGVFVANEAALTDSKSISNANLVSLFNSMSEKPVKKFETRAAGVKRLWALMVEKVPVAEEPVADEPVAEEAAAPKPKRGKKEKAAPSEPKTKGRKAGSGKFAGKTVFALQDVNPRRVGSHGFNSYEVIRGKKDGVPYAEYISGGGRPNDLKWDIAHKWAEVR